MQEETSVSAVATERSFTSAPGFRLAFAGSSRSRTERPSTEGATRASRRRSPRPAVRSTRTTIEAFQTRPAFSMNTH